MAHIARLRSDGTAVALASHDLAQISEHCDQVLLLERGQIKAIGEPEEVVEEYQLAMESATLAVTPEQSQLDADEERLVLRENRFGSQEVEIADVLVTANGRIGEAAYGERLEVAMTLSSAQLREMVIASVTIARPSDDITCLDVNTDLDDIVVGPVGRDPVRVTLSLDDLELSPGDYVVDVGVFPTDWSHAYDYHWHVYPLVVRGVPEESQAVYRPQQRRWTIAQQ